MSKKMAVMPRPHEIKKHAFFKKKNRVFFYLVLTRPKKSKLGGFLFLFTFSNFRKLR
jgi:hypothetical protein